MSVVLSIADIFFLCPSIQIRISVILFIVVFMIDLHSFWNTANPRFVNQTMNLYMARMDIYALITIQIDSFFQYFVRIARIYFSIFADIIAVIVLPESFVVIKDFFHWLGTAFLLSAEPESSTPLCRAFTRFKDGPTGVLSTVRNIYVFPDYNCPRSRDFLFPRL